METAEKNSQAKPESSQPGQRSTSHPLRNGQPVCIEPDLDFIHALRKRGIDIYKKCIQCGTCAATCTVSPDSRPFPRKEMAWAVWGMKDRLMKDPDVWLCFQCNDCSTRCPRGARPGEVLGAVRRESVIHYTFPRFLGKWVNHAKYIPLLLGFPAVLLGLLVLFREPIQNALGVPPVTGDNIVYSYSSLFHQRVLNVFFFFFAALVLLASVTGITRFWRALKEGAAVNGIDMPVKGLWPSIAAALKRIITHHNFAACTKARWRFLSHVFIFFGFLSLVLVTSWVITATINPLLRREFIYPFAFWDPWKMLANMGGAALVAGCVLMIWSRLTNSAITGSGTYPDWAFVWTLLLVVVTGFLTEVMHYLRMEPHRHVIYFIHLMFAFALLVYMPYSKFAHVIYRTTALIFAEYSGRRNEAGREAAGKAERSHE
ncbi:MAG: quinone-interacting membrane-bound oxidoreductase complex subunit QmoC [Candidatus Latescibacterota bacterium]